MQAGLVALDGQDEVRAALARQVLGVGALGVHRICGNHRPGQVDAVQQRREHGNLVRLRFYIHLPEDYAGGVVQGGQQMPPGLAGCGRSAQGLAVHRDHAPCGFG